MEKLLGSYLHIEKYFEKLIENIKVIEEKLEYPPEFNTSTSNHKDLNFKIFIDSLNESEKELKSLNDSLNNSDLINLVVPINNIYIRTQRDFEIISLLYERYGYKPLPEIKIKRISLSLPDISKNNNNNNNTNKEILMNTDKESPTLNKGPPTLSDYGLAEYERKYIGDSSNVNLSRSISNKYSTERSKNSKTLNSSEQTSLVNKVREINTKNIGKSKEKRNIKLFTQFEMNNISRDLKKKLTIKKINDAIVTINNYIENKCLNDEKEEESHVFISRRELNNVLLEDEAGIILVLLKNKRLTFYKEDKEKKDVMYNVVM